MYVCKLYICVLIYYLWSEKDLGGIDNTTYDDRDGIYYIYMTNDYIIYSTMNQKLVFVYSLQSVNLCCVVWRSIND